MRTPYDYYPPHICPKCGRYLIVCECNRPKENTDYTEYLRKLQEPKPAPTIDYDILAEKVAAKVVALLGKKKRRAAR